MFLMVAGVETKELQNILDFIYEGEARIEKTRLDSFLQTAQDLKIMGLFNQVNNHSPPPATPTSAVTKTPPPPVTAKGSVSRQQLARRKRKLAPKPYPNCSVVSVTLPDFQDDHIEEQVRNNNYC